MKRAQTSIEFLLLVAFGSLIFLVFFALIQDRIVEAKFEELNRDVKELADGLTSEINLASRFGDGYSRTIYLPHDIKGLSYNITIINDRDLLIQSNRAKHLYFFNNDIYGNFTKGYNNITVLANIVYINQDIEDLFNIKIDKKSTDWDTLIAAGQVEPLLDARGDSYSTYENNLNNYDLKQAYIWNDDFYLYFYIELYNNNIADFEKIGGDNLWDLLILLDTDLSSGTGYFSSDYDKLISPLGADFLINDFYSSINGSTLYLISNTSFYIPYYFDGLNQIDWDWDANSITPKGGYALIGSNAVEYKIPLGLNKLDLNTGDTVGYSIVSRVWWPPSSRGIVDYIPGENDEITLGVYTIK